MPIVKLTYSGMAIDRPGTAAAIRAVMRKAALIDGITRVVAGFRIPATEILLAILEPPLGSWGIRGGQQASQIYR